MPRLHRPAPGGAALLAAVAIACAAPALAQQQTTITRFSGTVSANGIWTRTITDITEPNGPGGGTMQAVYAVNVSYTNGMTAAQLASAYRAQCLATLPSPQGNPNGYSAVLENTVTPSVRLSKQAGTYNFSDGSFPPGVAVNTIVPSNAEHAPLASPAGIAALGTCLAAVAWWARRRRASA